MRKSLLIISFKGEFLFLRKGDVFQVFLLIQVTSFFENLAHFTHKLFIASEEQNSHYSRRKIAVVFPRKVAGHLIHEKGFSKSNF